MTPADTPLPAPRDVPELLPCPFCGLVPTIQYWHGGGTRKRRVSCDNEECTVQPSISGSTPRNAIEAWNTRASSPVSGAARTTDADKLFPIQKGQDIPWAVIAPFEKWAQLNHGQTFERLAQRGGLDAREALHVMCCVQWNDKPESRAIEKLSVLDANLKLMALVKERLAAAPTAGVSEDTKREREQSFLMEYLSDVASTWGRVEVVDPNNADESYTITREQRKAARGVGSITFGYEMEREGFEDAVRRDFMEHATEDARKEFASIRSPEDR